MEIFVQSCGTSIDYGYNWVNENKVIVEKPNILNSFIDLLQDSLSLLIARENQNLLLFVTGIPSARRDYQNRIIFISVAWIVEDDDDHVNEAKIRNLASKILLSKIFLPDTGEIKLKQTIDHSVTAGEENGFDVDFKSLQCLLEKQESSSPSKSELKPKLEIKSDDTIKQLAQLAQLAQDLKERSLPKKDRPLVVVTGIQSKADFREAKVWRGLANFVDERGGQKEEEINFRENIQGYKQSDDRHSKGGRKANEGSIQKRIVVSVLAILFCISLALGIWFYIQSNDKNPNDQQQNDNINSSNKPIQTLIMEPKAVQKELIPQEKTEELKEEKIKIMELKSLLLKAGFTEEPGEVSNTKWSHPLLPGKVILSGKDGNDAKPDQERDVINALNTLAKIKEDQQR
ncbi:hypothetical protein [Planktothrix agardhii]|uniref:hypothetical protein n=1 Tax=Planktothrix agardhii TaxID=1160 RepID=UPI0022019AA5|nr:hypothetical protein PCC7811_03389 [Planktothrix agardhii]